MAHKNDVIFTQEGLNEFIQLIRQNPEMVYKVRAATTDEIAEHNATHPTLAEGRIPGKGITIIQANGDKTSVAVGSDVKAPNFDGEIKNNPLFGDGTVTFIVDESYINIPVKGVTNLIDDDNTEIPNSVAVKDFIASELEFFAENLDELLNGPAGARVGYGFIPGYYTSADKTLNPTQQSTLNNNLKTLEIREVNGVYLSESGVVFSNGVIAKPKELLDLINEKKVQLLQSEVLQTYKNLLNQQENLRKEIENITTENTNLTNRRKNLQEVNLPQAEEQLDQAKVEKNQMVKELEQILVYTLNLPKETTYDQLSNELTAQGLELINLGIFESVNDINEESVSEKVLQYYNSSATEQSVEYVALRRWVSINECLKKMVNVQDQERYIIELETNKTQIEKEINEEIPNTINENNITIQDNQNLINSIQTTQIDPIKPDVDSINDKLNNIIPSTVVLIDAGADRTWKVIKTQSVNEIASLQAEKVYGAVYNDYAEYRMATPVLPGRVVVENGDGSLSLATKRLQLGANIVSDTFGFAIGQTPNASTPIAVCGRVLAYPAEDRETYFPGAAVCSGPGGTVSIMTREEIREWPDAIIGYVSEIPNYETWGTDNVKVDGRIWIKVV